ncbi:MAG TPA: HsdR family type I site-specific deoxyribonuclease [Candidatus Binataceae bacterium]|nr:HsdR family type I site-specific deoxyribonuclease [Candidatus Binataceae bacterium]
MAIGAEKSAVQNPLIRYAVEAGWKYISPDDAVRMRRGETGIVLHDVLIRQLQRLNPAFVDVTRAEQIVKALVRIPPNVHGNLQAWEYLKGLKTVFVEDEKRERNVRLLDPVRVEENEFHVTDELTFTNGTYEIRGDIVFFVNGVPVLDIETKAAKEKEGIQKAHEQIGRYHREAPELMAVEQLFGVTHIVGFSYGATWRLSRKDLYDWRDEAAGDFETLVKAFVAPRRILRVLTEFILFTRRDDQLSKVVLRPHQMRAEERVIRRALDPERRRGLIWHTQGSGKTYTMITVARRLIEDPAFENPTVLMLVDRNELEAQLFANLREVGFSNVEVTQTKRHLAELLRSDQRGLIVSTIHKFDDIPARINERANIFVLVDEAHRTTGGDLGNYLMGALPNATYIGLTGTPIDQTAHGKGTFKVFGTDDPKGYLDKYSIRESIQDGTTVPLHYQLAPNELLPDRETLEREFLNLSELEGVSDVEELNRVLDRAVTLKNMLKNRERVEEVAGFIARHFRETVEPMGYKALVVAPDREGCAMYKAALDKHLPADYSQVVISVGAHDREELKQFNLSEDAEKRVREAFNKPDGVPKILIVTEKLLTGFDAPILYCMYLDKPMRDHVLLQAIARVNRPYEDNQGRRKTAGFVLDFVGIFDKLEKALAFDSEDVAGVIEGLDVLKRRFEELMTEGRRDYLPIAAGKAGDKAVEALLEHFRDRELRHAFYSYYRELQELYEILSPDPFLRDYLTDYERLTDIYRILRNAYEPGVPVDRSFLRKTAALVQEHTRGGGIESLDKPVELNAEALEKIAGENRSDTVKIFNLVKAIHDLVEQEGVRAPHLIPIGERAAQVALSFEERQATTHEALDALTRLVRECAEAEQTRERSDLPSEAFTIFWLLKRDGVAEAEEVARAGAATFGRYPHWRTAPEQEREVRASLYKALIKAKVEDVTGFVERLLAMLRRRES